MKKIKAAVIGLGVGEHHLRTYLKSKYVHQVVAYDFDKKKIFKLRKKYPSVLFVNKESEIFKDKEIKILSIASYDNYHSKQILKSFKTKKNVFVEKPICLYKKELRVIQKEYFKSKLKLSSNLVLRTAPMFKRIKEEISKKKFGKIFYIEADYLWGRLNKFFGWRSNMKYYSKIYGAAIHMVDLIVWLLNKKPVEVFASGNKIATKSTKLKFNSFVSLNLLFPDGLIVKVTGNGPCVYPHFHGLKIYGTKKTFSHDLNSTFFVKNRNKIELQKINIKNKIYPAKNSRSQVLKNFLKNVINNSNQMLVNSSEIFDVMSICFAAEKSMKTGKKIKINYLNHKYKLA